MLVVLAVVAPGLAQGIRGEAGPLVTPITRAAAAQYAAMLGLTPEQAAAAAELQRGHSAALGRVIAEGDAALKAAEAAAGAGEGERGYYRRRGEAISAFLAEGDRLEREFMDDLRALLSAEQGARFDRVERAARRRPGLFYAWLAGARIDLVGLCDELEIAQKNPGVGGVLDEYELEIDRLVIVQGALWERLIAVHMKRVAGGGDPPEKFALLADVYEQGRRIRDTNRAFVRRLEEMLPEAAGDALGREFRVRSFPDVYRQTGAGRSLAEAAGLPDLSTDQRRELGAIEAAYAREAALLNDRWA